MQQKMLAEKYPVRVLELAKAETPHRNIGELVDAFAALACADPKVNMIGTFDHFTHTRQIGGEIRADIVDARNLLFCFGLKIPSPEILAVRPRSVGFAELADRFVISFLDAPNPEMNDKMIAWANSLRHPA